MTTQPPPLARAMLVVRALAVADAVALPVLGIYWISTWRNGGGVFGAVMASFLVWRGCKRASRAIYAYDEYRWIGRYLAMVVTAGLVLRCVAWALGR